MLFFLDHFFALIHAVFLSPASARDLFSGNIDPGHGSFLDLSNNGDGRPPAVGVLFPLRSRTAANVNLCEIDNTPTRSGG